MNSDTAALLASREVPTLKPALMAKLAIPLLPAEEVGRDIFGLGPFATRAAIKRGELRTIKIGRKHFCPTVYLREMLGLTEKTAA